MFFYDRLINIELQMRYKLRQMYLKYSLRTKVFVIILLKQYLINSIPHLQPSFPFILQTDREFSDVQEISYF